MEIRSFHEPESGTWTYLLADPDTGVTAVIDPVWVYDPVSGQTDRSFIDTVLETARAAGWRIEWVLETHAHADHLSAAEEARAPRADDEVARARDHSRCPLFAALVARSGMPSM